MPRESFRMWYAKIAAHNHLDPNPNDPRHFYDYQAAYRAGATLNDEGHLPSKFKKLGHPRLILDGIDTRTGEPATLALIRRNQAVYDSVMARYAPER